jgi:hypothetical protein
VLSKTNLSENRQDAKDAKKFGFIWAGAAWVARKVPLGVFNRRFGKQVRVGSPRLEFFDAKIKP